MTELRHGFTFDPESGTFRIRASDELALSGASVQAGVGDRTLDSVFLPADEDAPRNDERAGLGPGITRTLRFASRGGLAMTLEAFTPASAECVVLRLAVTNGTGDAVGVDDLQPLVLEGEGGELVLGTPSSEWVMLREGWHSWDAAGGRSLADDDFDVPTAQPGCLTSSRVAVLAAGEAAGGVLLGWLEEKRLQGQVLIARQGDGAAVRALATADGVLLADGETITSEPLMVRFAIEPLAALERYGDLFAERMAARVPARAEGAAGPPAVSGWLSWYTGRDVSDAMIRQNLARYAEEAARWKLDYWVIDDGWQSVAGDWLIVDDQKFPRGMKLVADGIRSAGLKPGLWVAPLLASEASILAREHADWLLKDERGEVVTALAFSEESHWRGRQFVLDITHPEAAEYVRRVIRTIVREWGYAYVKADFLHVAALPGARHDAGLTRTEIMRKTLGILRDEVGQRFLLACGCPIGPATGLADACRTGTDVAAFWHRPEADDGSPSTRNAVRNVIARYWQHGRLFLADPDALMVREVDTELTLEEVRTLVTVVAMSGGLAMWSDALDAASESRRALLDKALPVWPHAARPVHLLRSELSQTLVWELSDGGAPYRVVALLNLTDRPADLSLTLADAGCPAGARHHVFELWQESYLGTAERAVTVSAVPAHGVRVLVLRPATEGLDFLASTTHLTGGGPLCTATPRGLACDVKLAADWPRRGRLFLCPSDGYVVRTADGLLTARDDGSWSIEVDTSMTTEYYFEAVHEA